MGKVAATALGALLSLGMCGAASAQGTAQPDTQQTNKQAAQEKFDHEKVALKDQVSNVISETDQNIDALKKMSDTDKGDLKKRDDDAKKHLTMLRDHLKGDLDKIDKAGVSDWSGVRPIVERDLHAVNTALDKVATITKVPRTGMANPQPPSEGKEPSKP
jgi:hypothetical protein